MSVLPFRHSAVALGGFVVGAGVFSVAGLLPSLTIELDVSEAAAAQLVTVFGLVGAVPCPLFP
jgi:predicted MFS family arabinose efflux permease